MPWHRKESDVIGIRNICRRRLLQNIFDPLKVRNEWKVLILDKLAMSILATCFKTQEIMACNIAIIEEMEQERQALPYLPAIYILTPSEESIEYLKIDFVSSNQKYYCTYLFFLSAVPEDVFRNLCEIIHPSSVKLIKEIDILFLPYEAQVYSFDDDEFFATYFNSYGNLNLNSCGVVAKKLMTLFSTLEEFPLLRYRRRFIKNLVLAEAVEKELNLLKESFKSDTNPKAKTKSRCQLLILDRGFDCISPVVHEFTFQAMAYDILDIKDNIYEYTVGQDDEENVFLPLSDDDSLWCSFKHEHVAGVAKRIESMMDAITLIENNTNVNLVQKLPALGAAVKKHLLQKKHEAFYGYRHMVNECMKSYCGGINVLSELETDLVMGKSADGVSVKNVLTSFLNVVSSDSYTDSQKLRLFLLYIFFNKGITKSHFDEIVNKANLPFSDAYSITNVLHFDVDVFRPGFCEYMDDVPGVKSSDSVTNFKQSRWTPVLKNIILRCIDGTLSEELYPFVGNSEHETLVSSRRSRYWCADKKYEHMSRLVVFIAGGVTYSEMRCAYEIMAEHTGWEIIVGGDCILTPNKFLSKLQELKCFVSKDL